MTPTILAIDDHVDTVRLIEMALQRHGYHVIGASSGEDGLRLAREKRPDLIVLDMMMPGMNGIDVCRKIRDDPQLQDTPIIMFTANAQAYEKKQSFEMGADDYLTKPTRPAELLERVEALLSRRQPAQPAAADDRQARPQLPGKGPWFITVVGARGGAGATTMALNLAITLADQEHGTTLVDLDTQQGHVALYLDHLSGPDLVEWLNLPAGRLEAAFPDYLVQHHEHLHLLLSQAHFNPDEARLHASQVAALLAILRSSGRSVVVDVGKQLGAAVHPLFQASTYTIVCLRPERASIIAARKLMRHLKEIPGVSCPIVAIMLDFGGLESLPRGAVEDFLGFPLADVISVDARQIARAANRGAPLVHIDGNGQLATQFQQLLQQMLEASAA